jgi:omega-6 fatty acid desaturase (delta-12 desaturase)
MRGDAGIDSPASLSMAGWSRALALFRTPTNGRACIELATTLVPFVAAWTLTYVATTRQLYWAAVPLSLLASGLLVRLFLIQHDCGHRSFFANRRANDWIGRFLGVLTLTPYAHWRKAHATHHATHGNLDRRGVGDVDTLTVREYRARKGWTRWRYRLYRHSIVMFGIGPAYVFLISNRIPAGSMRGGWRPWVSTMGTNIAVGLVGFVLSQWLGVGALLAVHLPIILMAATAGVWLFYVQHQFEHSYWAEGSEWTIRDAGLSGSSHLALPAVLAWFTANIGVHHVHHLASGIPFYRLPDVLRAFPSLAATNRITLRQSFGCAALALWDERSQRLVRFNDLLSQDREAAENRFA